MQSLVDGIYAEVARGSYERAADAVYQLAITIFIAAFLLFPASIFLGFKLALKSNRDDSKGPIESQSARDRLRKLVFWGLILEFIVSGALIIGVARLSYIIRAANYLDQCERVVAPVLSQDQRLITASAIAQIQTKEDFVKIVDGLRSKAKANKLVLPQFGIF